MQLRARQMDAAPTDLQRVVELDFRGQSLYDRGHFAHAADVFEAGAALAESLTAAGGHPLARARTLFSASNSSTAQADVLARTGRPSEAAAFRERSLQLFWRAMDALVAREATSGGQPLVLRPEEHAYVTLGVVHYATAAGLEVPRCAGDPRHHGLTTQYALSLSAGNQAAALLLFHARRQVTWSAEDVQRLYDALASRLGFIVSHKRCWTDGYGPDTAVLVQNAASCMELGVHGATAAQRARIAPALQALAAFPGFEQTQRTHIGRVDSEANERHARRAAEEDRLRACDAPGCGKRELHLNHFKVCSACGSVVPSGDKVAYCSRECQQADWPRHKAACKAARKRAAAEAASGAAGGAQG